MTDRDRIAVFVFADKGGRGAVVTSHPTRLRLTLAPAHEVVQPNHFQMRGLRRALCRRRTAPLFKRSIHHLSLLFYLFLKLLNI